ncbi:histidine utilization repressor [Alteromonas halophila]|uniref:Histidine utilization repressor n=1 Tax=Alteromonas halophila TaxID=516698 RepID=A0A918N007_9ALTE|nr:histidine utilization repressor [Alteromonas halophila]GGW88086.1 histidine utilization repressor [Alteromonas halophila]
MQARFVTIKAALLDDIETGRLRAGEKVPSENQLAQRFSVSRMTARRALTELVDEGILARTQGVGTFVSDNRPMSSMLTIRGIQEEIHARGHQHQCEVLTQQTIPATATVAQWLGVAIDTPVYYTLIVHADNAQPVQLEARWVNPQWAPDYLKQDFTRLTANQYLNKVAPLTEADHIVEAVMPDSDTATHLHIKAAEPCLKISRRTFSARGVVSFATLIHPGNRYRLGDHIAFDSRHNGDTL